jgi:hypothetical protein
MDIPEPTKPTSDPSHPDYNPYLKQNLSKDIKYHHNSNGRKFKDRKPKTYAKVVDRLANSEPITHIAKDLKVSCKTINGILENNMEDIQAQRKATQSRILDHALRVAEKLVLGIEQDFHDGKITPRDKTIAFGVTIDKAQILQDAPTQRIQVTHTPDIDAIKAWLSNTDPNQKPLNQPPTLDV